ncbi:DUF4279 domain-containing protein [Bordetella genomosp. 5]|uniref:DUF4279 domain-containing protein n=1 Tax=Bordetella genomosp. 5 TaxID=1395608 RepID=A0A261TFK0_9BORD|nr:DUF4279 domain-containing protein [Bordetella genomosp. 5]OZI47992.1 hypothetical protein CAL25_16530 [Bordetella genomosp. 5]
MKKKLPPVECYADFTIYTGDVRPQDVTALLSMEPTMFRVRGEKFTTPSGKERVASQSIWGISSEKEIDSPNMADHFGWIMARLSTIQEAARTIQTLGKVIARVRLVVFSSAPSWAGTLDVNHMQILADLNINYSVGVYFDDGDEQD